MTGISGALQVFGQVEGTARSTDLAACLIKRSIGSGQRGHLLGVSIIMSSPTLTQIAGHGLIAVWKVNVGLRA